MKKLINYFNTILLQNEDMLKYLYERNVSDETIKNYKLGLFPEKVVDVLKYANAKKLIDDKILYSTFNGFKSMFTQNKLIIPVYDVYSEPIGIAGRVIANAEVIKKHGLLKYKNSGYDKTLNLFGLNIAKDRIREKDKVFIVEGYFDVIAAHQHGLLNFVAPCGTMLSNGQLNLLARYTENIYLLFDNDAPGQLAAERAIKRYENKKRIKIKRLKMEKFNDLDELLRAGAKLEEHIKIVR